jgi:hypothetical protein
VPLRIADLRSVIARVDQGVVMQRQFPARWETEGVEFDLGEESEFAQLGASLRRVFGSDYDRRITSRHHSISKDGNQHHRYRISRRVLEADLVISVPKLKTHKKTGVSLNIKNMIGINTDKNYIPHYRVGSPSQGGDEFPDTKNNLLKIRRWFVRHAIDLLLGRMGGLGEHLTYGFMRIWLQLQRSRVEKKSGKRLDPIDVFYQTVQGEHSRTGNWWGNDTTWRCGVDINKLLFYGDATGIICSQPRRRYFSVIDGIIAGEGEGPVAPDARRDGVLIAGFDPVSVDTVAVQIMGFNPALFRDLARSAELTSYPITDPSAPIHIVSNRCDWQAGISPDSSLHFQPHNGWAEYLGK